MEFKAGWIDQSSMPNSSGGKFIWSPASRSDAFTVIAVAAPGKYDVWSRAWDFSDNDPGTRRYLILIDGEPMPRESGQHKTEGFAWEKVGSVELAPGQHVIALRDTAQKWSRPDSVMLAPEGFDPTKENIADLQRYRIQPEKVAHLAGRRGVTSKVPAPDIDQAAVLAAPSVGVLESPFLRMSFVQAPERGGQDASIVRRLEIKQGDQWVALPLDPGAESLFVLKSLDPKLNTSAYNPKWIPPSPILITVNGRDYDVGETANPFLGGDMTALRAVTVEQTALNKVTVTYAGSGPAGDIQATGIWSLDGYAQRLDLHLKAPTSGIYSVGYSPFQAWAQGKVEFIQQPPLYQMQRFPKAPELTTSATMPHPMSLVQVALPGLHQPMTFTAAAAADRLPFQWGDRTNSPYGFSVLNADGQAQATVFSPVLGMRGSRLSKGQDLEVSFVAHCLPGDWKAALTDLSDNVFHVTDYREPIDTSLTDAALNMVDLLRNGDAAGWDDKLRGPYNIESQATVTHASPLTLLSTAILIRDQDFYTTRALPTVEFTLSRASFHHAVKPTLLYVAPHNVELTFSGKAFGPRYWQGVYELTERENPWIRALIPSIDEVKKIKGKPLVPLWCQMLGDYQMAPTPEKLAEVEKACQQWIKTSFHGRQVEPLGVAPFYNAGFYPFWWDLLDLYELTGSRSYLEAAIEGGFHTLSGLWSHPLAPEGKITVNPRGQFGGYLPKHLYYKGDKEYRLGYPRKAGDMPEHEVEAWKVGPMGMGLEQPLTLYPGNSGGDAHTGIGNIFNSAWAPSLLRLAFLTDKEIYRTYARNSIIGRFASYGGYYIDGFTDVYLSADYPYKGPDVTNVYYHHIPVHLGFVIDYIFAEAETLSKGAIKFPWVKQEGYVWFNNRQYGAAPGQVYGDTELWPWLDRKAFSVPSPQVNYFGAVGSGKLDVVVTNSSHKSAETVLRLDPALSKVPAGSAWEFLLDGKSVSKGVVGTGTDLELPLSLPVASVGVFRFASSKEGELHKSLAPVVAEPVALKLSEIWGKLHALRIRSPFGTDALYLYATKMAPAGSKMTLRFDSGYRPPITIDKPPYEISIPDLPATDDLKFSVDFTSVSGATESAGPIDLPGIP